MLTERAVLGPIIGSEEEQENRIHMVLYPVRFMPHGEQITTKHRNKTG